MISRLFATYRNFDASRFLLEFTTDRFVFKDSLLFFKSALPIELRSFPRRAQKERERIAPPPLKKA